MINKKTLLNLASPILFLLVGLLLGLLLGGLVHARDLTIAQRDATIQQLRKEVKERQTTVEVLYQEKMSCLEQKNSCENSQSELQTRLANAEKLLQGQD